MSSPQEWPSLALTLGLTYLERDQLPEGMHQAMAGLYQGFPTLIGQRGDGRKQAVAYLLRCAPGVNPEQVKAHLPESLREKVEVTETGLGFQQSYILHAPTGDEVAETFRQLGEAVQGVAQPPSDHCEVCDVAHGDFHVVEGIPTRLCSGCVEKMKGEQAEAFRAYEQLEAHPLRGTLWGLVAATMGGVGWGLFGYATGRLWALVALGIGYLVAWSIRQGTGKVTRYGQVLTVILTLGSVFLGDVLLLALSAAKEFKIPLSVSLLVRAMLIYPAVAAERVGDLVFSLLCGIIGAFYALRRFQRSPKPVKIV